MTKIIYLFFLLTVLYALSFAHLTYARQTPFAVMESHRRTIPKDTLEALEAAQPKAMVSTSGNALIFPDSIAYLIVRTGPENDMLSYRIQGLRNPTLVAHAGASIHILFVNVDDDMPHDFRVGDVKPPDTTGADGTMLLPHSEDETYSAEELTIHAVQPGKYPYFCSYRGHAINGMSGWVVIVKVETSMEEMMDIGVDTARNETPGRHGTMEGMQMDEGMGMDHEMVMSGVLRTEPMSQEGSGTSWLPASSPMYMWMTRFDDWMLMLHGDIMPRYDYQGGPRGASKFDAPNWFMGMLGHSVGSDGQFTTHLMMSLDPIMEYGKGYPLLLQTGETWQGVKLVDFQHPHDLFDEVSVVYSQRLSDKSSAYLYLGYPGEPALGPPVFMHRPSAMSDPNAPLSHHWMDATHITFGVATAGITVGNWKLEGSYFNGSEPDEDRYNFDQLKLNSYSGRLSFNPTDDLALQVSSGFIKNPEGDSVDVVRTTASVIYTKKFENGNWWSTTAAWGQNHEIDHLNLGALLLESQYDWKCWTFYGRAEYVQKTNGELSIIESPDKINDVEAVTFGLTRKLFRITSLDVDLGMQGTYNFVSPSLASLYTAHPLAYEIYFAIHPSLL
jgi:rusticyanin